MSGKTRNIIWDHLFKLSAASAASLQDQIQQLMVSAILNGRLPRDAPVPSGRELAEKLGVARNTVVLAYQQLMDDGYLISRERHGYFVNPDALRVSHPREDTRPAQETSVPDWSPRLRFKPSSQRNIAKALDWQNYSYPFIYGQFDASLFPMNDWRVCCQRVLSVMETRDWAPDLFTRDDPHLVEQIRAKVLPLRGVWAAPEEIIVTIGAQHALYLVADLLFSERTVVGMENPGYPDARNIFAIRTNRIRPLPIDEGGLRIGPELAGCDYVYATPSHQSPTTRTMPTDRRVAFLEEADARDFVIIEDDYESETSFSGLSNPALKSLDRSGRVICVGSLSKTLAPGLRLGYIVAAAPLIEELRALRRLMIRHPAAFIQRSFALFLSLGYYHALVRRRGVAHSERASALDAALRKYMPETRYAPINGGASIWIEGPPWLDCQAFVQAAKADSVLIEPGDVYFASHDPPLNFFRLGFFLDPSGSNRGRDQETGRRFAQNASVNALVRLLAAASAVGWSNELLRTGSTAKPRIGLKWRLVWRGGKP